MGEGSNIKPKIIFVGGSDNIGGAGILADVKTAEFFNCYSMVVMTCITAQNFNAISEFKATPCSLVIAQFEAIKAAQLAPQFVKISLLPGGAMIRKVAHFLRLQQELNIIYDTVFVKNNDEFFVDKAEISLLITEIIPQAYLTTSNVCEFVYLLKLGGLIHDGSASKQYGEQQIKTHVTNLCRNFLKINGYLVRGIQVIRNKNAEFVNVLYWYGQIHFFSFEMIQTKNDHGTGCAITAAITCQLALGKSIIEACELATNYASRCVALSDRTASNDFSINFTHR